MNEGEATRAALKSTGLSMGDIADRLKLSRQGLNYHLRKPVIDQDFKNTLKEAFPKTFNIESEEYTGKVNINGLKPNLSNTKKGVPYYDVDFIGGYDLIFNEQIINPTFYIDFLPFNDADCWINVTGKSMGPLIAHGDIVALKKVENWQRFLLEGEIYAIVTDNGFRTIKMVGAGPDKDHYMLIPYNKSPDYQPQPIPKDVITHVFRVKGAIKKFF